MKKHHLKVKFWNWEHLTIWRNFPNARFFFKNPSTLIYNYNTDSKKIAEAGSTIMCIYTAQQAKAAAAIKLKSFQCGKSCRVPVLINLGKLGVLLGKPCSPGLYCPRNVSLISIEQFYFVLRLVKIGFKKKLGFFKSEDFASNFSTTVDKMKRIFCVEMKRIRTDSISKPCSIFKSHF